MSIKMAIVVSLLVLAFIFVVEYLLTLNAPRPLTFP